MVFVKFVVLSVEDLVGSEPNNIAEKGNLAGLNIFRIAESLGFGRKLFVNKELVSLDDLSDI